MRHLHANVPRSYRILPMITIMALLLSSCLTATSTPPSTDETAVGQVVTVSFGAFEPERHGYQPLIDAFNQSHPGIHVQFVPLDDLFQANPGQSGPDDQSTLLRSIVSRVDTASEYVDPVQFRLGLLYDLKPLMDADAGFAPDDFYPNVLQSVTTGSSSYLVPGSLEVRFLSYNKALWTAQGIPAPAPDWSWQDLEAAAQQLSQRNGSTVSVYGAVDPAVLYHGMLENLDLESTSLDKLRFDRPELATTLDHVASMIESGAFYYWPFDQANEDEIDQLVRGQKAGMWDSNILIRKGDTPQPDFEIGSAAYPASNVPGLQPFSTHGYFMSSGTQHPNEAWTWLSFLSKQLAPARGRPSLLPARQSIAEQSGYWSSVDPEAAAVIQATLARLTPPVMAGTFDNSRIFAPLAVAMDEVIGGRPAAQALRDAQASLADVVAEILLIPTLTPDTRPIVVAPPVPDVAPAGATTITFGGPPKGGEQLRLIAQQFNQGNSTIFVQVASSDPAGGPPSLTDLAASADCFVSFEPPATSELTATLDLRPLIDADADFSLDDYPEALLAPYRQASRLSGLPLQVGFLTINYNQDAFNAAGVPIPTSTWTMDDFLNAAEQLTTGEGNHKRYGFVMPRNAAGIMRFLVGLSNARLTQGTGSNLKPVYTDPSVIQATSAVVDLLRHTSPHTQLEGYSNTTDTDDRPYDPLVVEGRAAMWFGNGWSPYGGKPDYSLLLAPPPLQDGILTSDALFTIGMYISAQTDKQAACWTWLKYLSASPTNILGGSPARRSIALSDAFKQVIPGAAEIYQAYDAAFERSGAQATAAAESQFDYFWFDRAVDHALQGQDLERELAAAQTFTEQFLACQQAGTTAATCATQIDPDYQGVASQ